MCLDTITKRVEKPSKKVTKAWKVFNIHPDTKQLINYFATDKPSPIFGRWMRAEEVEIPSAEDYNEKYITGFHCYTTKEEAEKFHGSELPVGTILIEVKVREITTYGTQWTYTKCDSLVARQMLVPRQPKTTQTKK